MDIQKILKMKKKPLHNFIWTGVIFSVFYWILESVRDVIAFERGTILERLFMPDTLSLWLRLLVVFIILLFSTYTQSMRKKAESENRSISDIFSQKNRVIWIGIIFGVVYWILEALRDVVVFEKGSFIKQVFTPDPFGFWMRILAIAILILLSIYFKQLIDERRQLESEFKQLRAELVKEADEEIKKLNREIEDIHRKLQSCEWNVREQKEVIRQKESMLGQMHHHFKTSLQHLSTMMDLKIADSGESPHKPVLDEIRTHLNTLTLLHSQIYQSNLFGQIFLDKLIRDLMSYLTHVYRHKKVELLMDNQEIQLHLQQAVPFGLLTSALIAAPGHSGEGNDSKDKIQLFIKESSDSQFSVKLRHDNQNYLNGLENKKDDNSMNKWIRGIVDDQLKGNLWLVRSQAGTEINIEFDIKG